MCRHENRIIDLRDNSAMCPDCGLTMPSEDVAYEDHCDALYESLAMFSLTILAGIVLAGLTLLWCLS